MANERRVYIETPRGRIVNVHHRDGTISMELQWNPSFSQRMNRNFNDVQMYVDSTVIRLMTPYTPMRNGVLYKSATLGTVIGSGEIKQVAPYARFQYYGNVMVSRITGSAWARNGESKVITNNPLQYDTSRHPLAGKMWFERMKADTKDVILQGARRYLNRCFFMNIIETVKDLLQKFPKISEVCNDVHVDFTEAETDSYGLSPTGDTLLFEDVLGNQTRQHTFTLYAVYQSVNDYDRLANSGVLLELQMWLEREGTGMSISAEVGNETFTGTVKKIVCSNGMVYAVPQENMTDGVMYQLQINAQYTIESEEF